MSGVSGGYFCHTYDIIQSSGAVNRSSHVNKDKELIGNPLVNVDDAMTTFIRFSMFLNPLDKFRNSPLIMIDIQRGVLWSFTSTSHCLTVLFYNRI